MYSATQLTRIRRLAHDEYADARERTALVRAVESSEELHQVAIWFNYDAFEIRELEEIVDHPLCAKGTAAMIYWCLQPDYTYRQLEKKKELPPELQTQRPFLKELERRVFEEVFRGTPIAFTPSSIIGRSLRDDDVYRPGIRLVPAWMKSDIDGATVERQRLEEA